MLLYPDRHPQPDSAPPRKLFNAATLTLVVAALLMVLTGLLLGTWINAQVNPTDPTTTSEYARLVLLSLPVWPIVITQQLLYRSRYLGRVIDEISRVVRAIAAGILLMGGLSIFTKIDIGRQWLLISGALVLTLVVAERLVARTLFNRARRQGTLLRPVLIAGRNAEGQLVRDMIDDDPSLGFRFDGFLEDVVQSEPGESPLALLGDTSRVLRSIEQTGVSSVIIAATAIDVGTSNRLIRALSEYGVHVELSSTLCDIAAHRLTVRPVGRVPMMYIEPVKRTGWRPRAKRLFDLLSAALLLIPGIPVMMLAAVAIKLTSPGSVLFRQVRVGRDGELFEILKLRTMVQDAEARLGEIAHLNESTGPLFKVREDPRITRVGKLLRKLSIDELPQLINVVRGDMSLVGPRPALPGEVENWDAALHNRLRVQPGITGMWQVMGRSDGDHDSRYAQLDLYYVDNWSLVTDLVIVARTIPVVIGRKGQH